jgi:hypothetical protein
LGGEHFVVADCVSSTAATFKVVESLTTGEPVAVPEVTAS